MGGGSSRMRRAKFMLGDLPPVESPAYADLAESLRRMLSDTSNDEEDPISGYGARTFQSYLNGSGYGRDEHAELVSRAELDELVATQRSPRLYMRLPADSRADEIPRSQYVEWLTQGKPVAYFAGVAHLQPSYETKVKNGTRDGRPVRCIRATFKPGSRLNMITVRNAEKLLDRLERAHGPVASYGPETRAKYGVGAAPGHAAEYGDRLGAMSALAASLGFDAIRFNHPGGYGAYQVLHRGVLVTDGGAGWYKGTKA